MKANATFLAIALLIATSALGQEQAADSTTGADYSRDNLLRLFADVPEPPDVEPRIQYRVGAIDFRALGTSWRFVYLPIMMPFSGTRPTTSRSLPDPFSLTNTIIATPPRSWRTQREVNREMRRIEQTERARIRVE